MIQEEIQSAEVMFKNVSREYSNAVVNIALDDGTQVSVVRPVGGETLGEVKAVGGLNIDRDVVVALIDGEVVGFSLVDVQRSGDFKVEDFDWGEIRNRFRRLKETPDAIDQNGKFNICMADNDGKDYLPGTTAKKFALDLNLNVEGLVELFAQADKVGKSV